MIHEEQLLIMQIIFNDSINYLFPYSQHPTILRMKCIRIARRNNADTDTEQKENRKKLENYGDNVSI